MKSRRHTAVVMTVKSAVIRAQVVTCSPEQPQLVSDTKGWSGRRGTPPRQVRRMRAEVGSRPGDAHQRRLRAGAVHRRMTTRAAWRMVPVVNGAPSSGTVDAGLFFCLFVVPNRPRRWMQRDHGRHRKEKAKRAGMPIVGAETAIVWITPRRAVRCGAAGVAAGCRSRSLVIAAREVRQRADMCTGEGPRQPGDRWCAVTSGQGRLRRIRSTAMVRPTLMRRTAATVRGQVQPGSRGRGAGGSHATPPAVRRPRRRRRRRPRRGKTERGVPGGVLGRVLSGSCPATFTTRLGRP
jgi:hypothetical protein